MTVSTWTPERIYSLIIGVIAGILTILLLSSCIVGWLNSKLPLWVRAVLIVLGAVSITTREPILVASTIAYISVYVYNYFKKKRIS